MSDGVQDLTDLQNDEIGEVPRTAPFVVDVDGYEGPIDVLLNLARDQKVDLIHISILELADQYLKFVQEVRESNLELAADYLVMAAWLAYLKAVIAPAAREEFDQRHIDIMAPLWRRAADALAAIPFDPKQPEQHASQAFLLAHAWQQCLTSVEQTPDWFTQASLHDRRISALAAMREHQAERAAWMMYCWFCPDTATIALDQANLHACGLHALWQHFSGLENEQHIGDFPSLIALRKLSIGDQAITLEHAQHTQGFQDYQQVTALLASEQQGETNIALRSALKTSKPWLFQVFMAQQR